MLIKIVNHHAEQTLLSRLERDSGQSAVRGALFFRCGELARKPSEEELIAVLKPELSERRSAVYIFQDGDIVITWNGAQKTVLDSLCHLFYERFCKNGNQNHHLYFDVQAQGEDLRLLCKRKIADLAKPKTPSSLPMPLPDEMEQFTSAKLARKQRKTPEVLVVEDQLFSRKLLSGLLRRQYKTCDVASAEEGLKDYYLRAPDVVFLDIELPGMNGHFFTETVRQIDETPYIILVSANNYMDDVIRARKNGVKNFIVKPYSKQKIMEAMNKFLQQWKQ